MPRNAAVPSRTIGLLVLLGVTGMWSASLAAAPQNGGFEDDGGSLAGWTTFNDVLGNVGSAAVTPRSGTHVAKLWGGFNGDPNYSGMFQARPACAGQTWTATAWTRHNTGDSLHETSNSLVLKLEFYRTHDAAYGGPDFLGEESVEVLSQTAPLDAWTSHTLASRAPAETVEVRVAFVFVQIGNAGGAALIDDVTLATEWDTVWQDEFNGGSVDTSKWRVLDAFVDKNNELQYYAPDDVYIDDGHLVLRSQQRWYEGHQYTSGLVDSSERFAHAYGRLEIRAMLPGTKGMWPAHWMMPTRPVWPPEIDIMELVGDVPDRVTMSFHWGPVPPGQYPWDIGQTVHADYWGPDFTQEFHTFALEWMPGRLYWLVDDVVRFSSIRSEIPAEPFYVILNTAVGGDWPGPPDGSSVFPQHHLINYVRWSVPADPGDPLVDMVDTTTGSGSTDGVIMPDEYGNATTGINSSFGDRIGDSSTMLIDSDADGCLNIAFDSATTWPTTGVDGVVIYIDSVAGGFASTYELNQATNLSRRLISGNGDDWSERSEVFFALGFRADYAIVLQPSISAVYQMGKSSHTLINGAGLGFPQDVLGGDDVAYRGDGASVREFRALLDHIGVAQGERFSFVVTTLNGNDADRSNEFVGVAPGNPWDGGHIGANSAVLKPGDFIRFRTSPRWGDYDTSGVVDLADYVRFRDCLSGPNATPAPPPVESDACLNAFDVDRDADVDLADYRAFQAAFVGG